MKNAKIAELKNNLSRLLAYVRRGGTVRVYDRDVPIADLTPIRHNEGAGDAAADALLAQLELEGLLVRSKGRLPADFLERRLPRARTSVVSALLDERREGR